MLDNRKKGNSSLRCDDCNGQKVDEKGAAGLAKPSVGLKRGATRLERRTPAGVGEPKSRDWRWGNRRTVGDARRSGYVLVAAIT